MPYFLSDKNLTLNQQVEISGEEARHILFAQRIKKGEKIKLQGPNGKRFLSEVVLADKKSLKVLPLESVAVPAEPAVKITLFQSVVSEKALDFIFQKGTELGLSKVVLFNSANTAAKLSADKFKSKQERWNKILMESAKQCERAVWPGLEFLPGADEVILAAKNSDKVFLADIKGDKLNVNGQISNVAILIGPEGGFAPLDMEKFKSLPNLSIISLGNFVLRAETAAVASLALLSR
jgi:16S rRNA (uracil1498-N3)-methyltransferase